MNVDNNKGRWGWAGLLARLALGSVLIAAGASKTSAPPEEFAVVIEAYDIVPVDAAQSLSALLPWAELLLGFSLVFGFLTPYACLSAAALLAAFLLVLLSTKVRHIQLPNCGCFGTSVHLPTTATMMMDALLLLATTVAFRHGAAKLSLDGWATAARHPSCRA